MHVAIIPDGNRRWAKEHGFSPLKGHEIGIKKLEKALKWAKDKDIDTLSLWILSTENLNRSEVEIRGLYKFFENAIINNLKDEYIKKYNVKVNFFGEIWLLPERIQKLIKDVEQKSSSNTEKTLNLFIAYGGRAEILYAVNSLIDAGIKNVDEETFSKYLFTKNVSDPDLIIRTSGELRTSGFLPWQGVYSEYFFSDKLWPDFEKQDFDRAVDEYLSRKRRFGK